MDYVFELLEDRVGYEIDCYCIWRYTSGTYLVVLINQDYVKKTYCCELDTIR